MNPRIIALYLPQFYKVPENDYWWGEGFTDWVSAKNAVPLFEGHYQPHIPYGENYYNLLNKDVMQWQADLMKEYGVDGLCFYHYWFGNEKMMLEKPAENLLEWKDVDMPFCFCWANMSWARSWAKLDGMDYWIGTEDEKKRHSGKAVLIEQIYGDKQEWENHFNYLLPFFKDDRYIKVQGKPLLWIYRLDLLQNSSAMIEYMQNLAIKNGLNGLFFTASYYRPDKRRGIDAAVIYEPGEVMPSVHSTINDMSSVRIYDYDEYWRESIRRDYSDIKTYYTGLVNYDSTARQGNKGEVISGSPKKFEQWLKVLLKKSYIKNNEFVFLNAWNEWGEGNHIEPDERHKFGYLEAIREAKCNYQTVSISNYIIDSVSDREIKEITALKNKNKKVQSNLSLLEKWLALYQKGIFLTDSSVLIGVTHVAIYGYGVIGKLLVDELKRKDSNCIIDYIVDRNYKSYESDIDIDLYSPDDELPLTELMLVSLTSDYQEVLEILNEKHINNYVLIEEIIRSL